MDEGKKRMKPDKGADAAEKARKKARKTARAEEAAPPEQPSVEPKVSKKARKAARAAEERVDSATRSAATEEFLGALAYASHTRDEAQFRNFTDDFAKTVAAALPTAAAQGAWGTLRTRIRRSQFPLVVWEPTVDGDAYLFVHLSFQEFFAARHLVRCALELGDAPEAAVGVAELVDVGDVFWWEAWVDDCAACDTSLNQDVHSPLKVGLESLFGHEANVSDRHDGGGLDVGRQRGISKHFEYHCRDMVEASNSKISYCLLSLRS